MTKIKLADGAEMRQICFETNDIRLTATFDAAFWATYDTARDSSSYATISAAQATANAKVNATLEATLDAARVTRLHNAHIWELRYDDN